MANPARDESQSGPKIPFGIILDASAQLVPAGGEAIFSTNFTPQPDLENPRKKEFDSLMDYFKQLLQRPRIRQTAIITGPAGSGKTYLVRTLYQELNTFVRRQGLPKLKLISLSGRINPSKSSILEEILRQLTKGKPGIFLPEAEVVVQIKDALESQDLSMLVAIDDIDALDPATIRTTLNEMMEIRREFIDASRVNLLLLTRDELLAQQLADGLITEQREGKLIILFPYSRKELFYILQERARRGLYQSAWTQPVLDFVVELNSEGNAWVGLDLLARTISIAVEEQAEKIRFDHVRSAYLKPPIDRATFQELHEHEQVMLLSIAYLTQETQRSVFTPKEIKEKYVQLCERSGRDPMRSTAQHNWLNGLERRGFILQNRPSALNRVDNIQLGSVTAEEALRSLNYQLESD